MIQEFFYSFLSGISWFLGLDSDFVSFFKSEIGRESADIVSIAALAGLLNVLLLYIFRKKTKVDIGKAACIAVPALFFEFFCSPYFAVWMPGLRSAAWTMIVSGGVLYLIYGIEKINAGTLPLLLIVFGYLLPLNGSLSLALLILILYKHTKKADISLQTVFSALALLTVARIVKSSLTFNNTGIDALSTSASFLGASLGGALSIFLILKITKSSHPKISVHNASVFAVGLLFMTSRYGSDLSGEKAYIHQFSSMGTVCEVTIWGTDKDVTADLLKGAEKIFRDIENTLSTYKPESEISKMNNTAYSAPHKCSETMWQNLMLAKKGFELTNGNFDVTIGPLVRLWGIKNKRSELPSQDEINKVKRLVGFNKLILDSNSKSIRYPAEGVKVDFGGLTKGWAVDRARDYLIRNGVRRGIVNLGGNLYCFGTPPKGKKKYTVGIKDPRTPVRLATKADLLDQSISTSGNYEQFIIINGKRYTHIISPVTGMPVSGVDSVTVVHRSAAICDMLSTGIFAGGKAVRDKLKSQPDLNYLLIDIREGEEPLIETHGPVFDNIKIELH